MLLLCTEKNGAEEKVYQKEKIICDIHYERGENASFVIGK